jgi:myosin heavy subunit
MLQQHFNNNTFKMEETLYRSEGIDFVHVEFIDNEPMIELITQARRGILPMLDEELRIPGGCVP